MIQRNHKIQYVFVVLRSCSAPINDIKTILCEKQIQPKDGVITFYTPYKELLSAYRAKFYSSDMWGMGFSMEALQKKAKCTNGQRLSTLKDGELQSISIQTSSLDFSELDLKVGEAFFVAPNGKSSEQIWCNGIKTDATTKKQYKQWWCKGLRNDVCRWKSDGEIAVFLEGVYKRFGWMNYKEVDKNDIFPVTKLFDSPHGVYSLLNLTPQELHDVEKRSPEDNCATLF